MSRKVLKRLWFQAVAVVAAFAGVAVVTTGSAAAWSNENDDWGHQQWCQSMNWSHESCWDQPGNSEWGHSHNQHHWQNVSWQHDQNQWSNNDWCHQQWSDNQHHDDWNNDWDHSWNSEWN